MGRKTIEYERRQAIADEGTQWWRYAVESSRALRTGLPRPRLDVHGIVLAPNEHAITQGQALYSRLYGGDGTYYRSSTFALGNPAFVLGAVTATAIGNSARRRAAQRNAAVTWREHQHSPFLITTHRVLCLTAARGWLSFYFSGVTEFHPDLDRWSVVLAFGDADPLQLQGPAAPALALWCGNGILGDRWQADPRLHRLLQ